MVATKAYCSSRPWIASAKRFLRRLGRAGSKTLSGETYQSRYSGSVGSAGRWFKNNRTLALSLIVHR
jgi:hypothetical protein